MRYLIYFLITMSGLLVGCHRSPNAKQDKGLPGLYSELDNEIAHAGDYEDAKEKRIGQLRRSYGLSQDKHERMEIINSLIDEYDAYNADSTLYYISCNLRDPNILSIPGEYTRLVIKRADVLAHTGLFSDALAAMSQVPADSVSTSLREAYYSTYCGIYQYLSEYAGSHETVRNHEKMRALYTDSLSQVIKPNSFNYMVYVMTELARRGDRQSAIPVLQNHLKDYAPATREYSILASTLAYMYKLAGMDDEYRRYLVLSAISDVKGAVKENMSFRAVATVMFEDGDIERANRYLKKSIADANFYSALMRNVQSSKILPVIDEAYTLSQRRTNSRLRTMVWISSILSFVLVITVLLILKQYKSLHKAHDEVKRVNGELNSMSEKLSVKNSELAEKNDRLSLLSAKLQCANEELETKNSKLHDFNKTKEQYAGLFMEYCSSAISSLQHYQQSLRVLTARGGSKAALLKKLESTEASDQLLKNFYSKFDEAILNIYPEFVGKFNALLKPGEQVILKAGELLNTELRLFALIRIGIDDSQKIAAFLRCSIATVYTYRSKMKKRALHPDEFEHEIRQMG